MAIIKLHAALRQLKERGYTVTETGEIINPKGKEIKGYISNKGYRTTYIRLKDKAGTGCVPFHKYISFLKYGEDSLQLGIHTRHLNSKPLDNSWDNIAIGTASENHMDKLPEVRMRAAMKATEKVRKYDREQVKSFYKENGWTKTLDHFNISSKGTLSFILNK